MALTAVVIAVNGFAQDAPKKETVIVDIFARASAVPANYGEGVRNGVINGFTSKGRFTVIDAATDAKFQELNKNRKTEDAVTSGNVLDEARSAVIKSMGAKFIIIGSLTNYSSKYATKDGKTTHTSTILFSLKGYDISSGEVIASKEFEVIGHGAVQKDADNDAIKDVSGKMSGFVNENFPFYTNILELGEKKGNKIKELYINCGSAIGVKKGDLFSVFIETTIAGKRTTKEIAKLRAIEVAGEEVTKCTVTSGGDIINESFNSDPPKVLIVKSKGESLFGGII